jgi:hypothetical protein
LLPLQLLQSAFQTRGKSLREYFRSLMLVAEALVRSKDEQARVVGLEERERERERERKREREKGGEKQRNREREKGREKERKTRKINADKLTFLGQFGARVYEECFRNFDEYARQEVRSYASAVSFFAYG